MHGERVEGRWNIATGRLYGYAMSCQCRQRIAGEWVVLDGRCSEGCLVYGIHGTIQPLAEETSLFDKHM